MQNTDLPCPVSKLRLKLIKEYISQRAPLVAEGRKIVVDEKAVDHMLVKALHNTSVLSKIFNKKNAALSPQKMGQLKKVLMKQFNDAAEPLPFDGSDLEKEAVEPKRTLIMAPPTKLRRYNQREKMLVFKAWLSVRHALVKAGAHLETVSSSPETGGIREVYTRDRYLMINGTAYLPDPRMVLELDHRDEKDYIGEIRQIEKALRERGVKTEIVRDAWFEGGNVVRHFGSRTIFVGMDGDWSTEESAQKLLNAINANEQEQPWSLLNVPLVNYRELYHMDTGMSEELPHGEVMLSPLLTDAATYRKIRDIVGSENIIDMTRAQISMLATNFIDVGDTLVLTGQCDGLKKDLEKRGYTVVLPGDYDQSSFEFGKGGVHCMTNDVPQKPQPRPSAPAM